MILVVAFVECVSWVGKVCPDSLCVLIQPRLSQSSSSAHLAPPRPVSFELNCVSWVIECVLEWHVCVLSWQCVSSLVVCPYSASSLAVFQFQLTSISPPRPVSFELNCVSWVIECVLKWHVCVLSWQSVCVLSWQSVSSLVVCPYSASSRLVVSCCVWLVTKYSSQWSVKKR